MITELEIQAEALWERYFADAQRESQYDKQFDSFIGQAEKAATSEVRTSLQPWLHIFEDSIQ